MRGFRSPLDSLGASTCWNRSVFAALFTMKTCWLESCIIVVRIRFPGGSAQHAVLLLLSFTAGAIAALEVATLLLQAFGLSMLCAVSLLSCSILVHLNSPGWTFVHPPFALVGNEAGLALELSAPNNPGEARGGSKLPCLVALAPETSEHSRLMLSLYLPAASRNLLT